MGRYLSQLGVADLDCDVTQPESVEESFDRNKPDIVLHLASKSDVDFCEKVKNEKIVIATNTRGTFHVASAAEKFGCGVVLISSGHVFKGDKWVGGYKELSTPAPINFYGMTKLAAEGFAEVFPNLKIIRTSYIFDKQRLRTHLSSLEDCDSVEFPTFIKRSFMYLHHFSLSLLEYAERFLAMPKILHLSGGDTVSWHEFMKYLAYETLNNPYMIVPRKKDLLDRYAPRGHNLGLNTSLSANLGFKQYSYKEGIQDMLI